MGYGLDGQSSIPCRGNPPQCPDQLWGPPSLLSDGYQRQFPGGLSGWGMKVTTDLNLVLKSRMVELYLHSPIFLVFVLTFQGKYLDQKGEKAGYREYGLCN
jgi:hypothetical protein